MAERFCRVCGRSFPPEYAFTQGRCQMCAIYWRRHGEERPLERLPQPRLSPGPCQTCGRPVRVLRRGRCSACYHYWYRHNRERPPELWVPE